jgi:hypothetical protein
MICFYSFTPYGVRVALKRAGREFSRKIVSLTQWMMMSEELEEQGYRMIEAPRPR